VWRNGKEESLTIVVEEIPESDKDKDSDTPGASLKDKMTGGLDVLGMKLQKMTPEIRKSLDIDAKINGVVVVDADKSKDKETLKVEDVIIQVDGADVVTPEDILAKVDAKKKQNKKSLLFQINRKGQNLFIALSLEDAKK
jgi:serine protease Do